MQGFTDQINLYVEIFRQGDADNAFHGLRQMDRTGIPDLMTAYNSEHDDGVRELLLEIIWQYRDHSVIPFLGEALMDKRPRIWREALDGLVALKSPSSLEALKLARTRQFPTQHEADEFHRWLNEAIEQAETRKQ